MDESVLVTLARQNSFALVEQIARESPPLEAVKALELGKHLYWKQKKLAPALALLRAGAQLALTAETADDEKRTALRSAGKGLCYDIASFAWPGWAEPDIAITETDAQIGLDAAQANLRLGEELRKGELPLSRAHWMLAAQLTAAQRYSEAETHFRRGALYAEQAGAPAEVLVCRGFAILAQVLSGREEGKAAGQLSEIRAALEPMENGAFFVSQIDTASRVFAVSGEGGEAAPQ